MFTYFKEKRVDIICVQESHITEKDVPMWERQWGGRILHNEGTGRKKGELILVSKFFKGDVKLEEKDDRLLIAAVQAEDIKFTLINIYAPNENTEKIDFFDKLQTKLKAVYAEENIILMGDFNTVMSNELDIIAGRPHCVENVSSLRKVVNSISLTDVWRLFHEKEKAFTWYRSSPFIARRLDYCFVSKQMLQLCINCEILTVPNTDHKAVTLEVSDTQFTRGPGYWRFNNSYLNDTAFTAQMKELLNKMATEFEKITYDSAVEKWEFCKIRIREFCTEYGKMKAYNKKNNLIELQIRLKNIELKLIADPSDAEAQREMIKVKNQIEIIAIEKARGAQIRSRTRWVEEGEKNTKYFLSLEKSRGNNNTMTSLRKNDGTSEIDQSNILREQYQYFSNIYSQSPKLADVKEGAKQFMKDEHFPTLDENEAKSCEGPVTLEEANEAIKLMKNGSSPGSDGITIEFIKHFWDNIKDLVIRSYGESFQNDKLSYSQRQGIIILIHKGKELSRDQLNNWRPITLLNTDYKILAKILTLRLTKVITKLINADQVGYLKNRNISTIIRTIDDTIDYLNNTNKSGYLLALDYQKAFDSISKDFLLESFNIFGFGEEFRKWIGILNNDVHSCINHGGWLSQSFPMMCGIRQGCPFSPLAFILAVELLAIKIRNSQIKGTELPTNNQEIKNLKIKQLADDTTLFLRDKEDMVVAANIIQDFSDFSNLKLNREKTKAMQIGNRLIDENIPFKIVETIKILGIHFRNNIRAQNMTENWDSKIDKMIRLIRAWNQRDLSIHGKIVIIKSLLISQFTFIMQSIGLPEHVLSKINTILYKFVWQRKYSNKKAFEKVKRKVMEGNTEEGGLKMINIFSIQTAFYLQWMGRLSNTSNDNWALIPKWYFEQIASADKIFDVNCKASELQGISKIKNEFWKRALSTYLNCKQEDTFENVQKQNFKDQLIWNNSLLKYKSNTLFFPRWKHAGIESVNDLINENENRLFSLTEIQNMVKQNKANTLFEYNALLNAIPSLWKEWVTHSIRNEQIESNKNCKASIFVTKPKEIIKILKENTKENQSVKPCAHGFWRRKLGVELNSKMWTTPSIATQEIRLRELQWKIMHNIYPTNILLNKMKVVDDNKCSYCTDKVDFLEHFFYECTPVKVFWKKVDKYIFDATETKTHLTLNDVVFGLQNQAPCKATTNVINEIILIGKMCISIKKKTKSSTNLFLIFENQLSIRKK